MTHLRKLLLAAVAAVVVVAMAAPAAQAATPAPGYTQFAGCPSPAENPELAGCIRNVVTGGFFKMGNKNVPITKPIVITGGVKDDLSGFSANSQGGMTKVQQQVPGGVIGLTGLDWLVNFLDIDTLQLFAQTELVGKPQIGEGFTLPIRVKLINPVLGNNCYVGSASNPIHLNLLETKSPTFTEHPTTGITTILGGEFTDKTFSAPGATGCTLTLFGFSPISINGLVNSQSGLPAPSGTNETVQKIDLELAPRNRVYP
jgi:hypothetical protein